jgi:hypothetical protein
MRADRDRTKGPDEKETVPFATPASVIQDEMIMHDRIMYDMRQNLIKLKEFGKAAGFAFDVSLILSICL